MPACAEGVGVPVGACVYIGCECACMCLCVHRVWVCLYVPVCENTRKLLTAFFTQWTSSFEPPG